MRTSSFIVVLVLLSLLCGYLLSKATLVGRAGIHLFYKEYRFLSVWWQGALAVLAVFIVLYLLLLWVYRKTALQTAVFWYVVVLLAALAGLWFTYQDFRTDLSQRWLGERFHLGAYLFWLGCALISLFYLFIKKRKRR